MNQRRRSFIVYLYVMLIYLLPCINLTTTVAEETSTENIIPKKNPNYRLSNYRLCPLSPAPQQIYYNLQSETYHATNASDITYIATNQKSDNSTITTSEPTQTIKVLARQCTCAQHLYCLRGEYCGVSTRYAFANFGIAHSHENNEKIQKHARNLVICMNFSHRLAFIKNTWPVILFWYIGLLLVFSASRCGRHVRNYIRTFWNISLTQEIASQTLRHEREQQSHVIHHHHHRQYHAQAQQQQQQVQQGLYYNRYHFYNHNTCDDELVLKIKRFEHKVISQEEKTEEAEDVASQHDAEVCCTICMTALNEGDRIGALPCNHCFHVECLKQWLKRRNVCPLCLTPDIAATRPRRTRAHAHTYFPIFPQYYTRSQRERIIRLLGLDEYPNLRQLFLEPNMFEDLRDTEDNDDIMDEEDDDDDEDQHDDLLHHT